MTLTRRDLLRHAASLASATIGAPAIRLLAQAPGPVMVTLSEYMAGAATRPLPPAVVEQAKHHILDTLAAMISGSELPPGRAALAFASSQAGSGAATVVASMTTASPMEAALANGVLAHADETDDSHSPSQSHPGAAVVAASLAMGESLGVDGTRFLRAVTLGYDVGTRVTMALGGIDFRSESHQSTHAIAGVFGAASAAACEAGLTAQQMRWVMDYTAQQSSGIAAWSRDTDHIEKAFVFGGMPARNGVTAATLVRLGWNGVDDVFSGDDNFFLANAPDGKAERLIDGLGRRFEIGETDIKKWTVGSPIQAPLDALDAIRRKQRFDADAVKSVTVRLAPSVGVVVDNREMPDISLQHMMAVMLVDGTASFKAAHDKARMGDPRVLKQRAKVRLVKDEALAGLLPVRVADVEVVLVDGTRLSERVTAVRGTPRNPMTREEVIAKARDLSEPVLGASKVARLVEMVFGLEDVANVRTLATVLKK